MYYETVMLPSSISMNSCRVCTYRVWVRKDSIRSPRLDGDSMSVDRNLLQCISEAGIVRS